MKRHRMAKKKEAMITVSCRLPVSQVQKMKDEHEEYTVWMASIIQDRLGYCPYCHRKKKKSDKKRNEPANTKES